MATSLDLHYLLHDPFVRIPGMRRRAMPFESRRAKLALDEETRVWLQSLSVSYTAPAAHVERAKVLLAYAGGETVSAIARGLRANRPEVGRSVARALPVG